MWSTVIYKFGLHWQNICYIINYNKLNDNISGWVNISYLYLTAIDQYDPDAMISFA